jgi:hypothetical protein
MDSGKEVYEITDRIEGIAMTNTGKPNILVLWGDDIGWWNISYNSRGQMG